MFGNALRPSWKVGFLTHPTFEVDFGHFWKFQYLLNRARKPLKMGCGVLFQLLELLLLIYHLTMFGPIGHWTSDIGHWTLDIGHWTFFFWIVLCLGLKRSAHRMLRDSNSGWSLSVTQFWESKCPKLVKVPFLRSEWVKMVRKSKFSKRFQTIPKHDWTWKDQCLAISEAFFYSHNFSYCS